jgi:hypothetical protein
VIVKAANAPRPGNWVLEKSIDGEHFTPWQYFAITSLDCLREYGIQDTYGIPNYLTDDQVICTTRYSKINPLENGEVCTTRYSKINPLENGEVCITRYSKINPLENGEVCTTRYSKINPLENGEVSTTRYSKINPLENGEVSTVVYTVLFVSYMSLTNGSLNKCSMAILTNV